jgi:hypothetical protein
LAHIIIGSNGPFISMMAGGLTSMMLVKYPRRQGFEATCMLFSWMLLAHFLVARRWQNFRLGFFLLAVIEIFLILIMPVQPGPRGTMEPQPGYWLERQKEVRCCY